MRKMRKQNDEKPAQCHTQASAVTVVKKVETKHGRCCKSQKVPARRTPTIVPQSRRRIRTLLLSRKSCTCWYTVMQTCNTSPGEAMVSPRFQSRCAACVARSEALHQRIIVHATFRFRPSAARPPGARAVGAQHANSCPHSRWLGLDRRAATSSKQYARFAFVARTPNCSNLAERHDRSERDAYVHHRGK